MARIDPALLITSDPEVVGCMLGEGSALLNLRTNIYYSLNEVGAFVWGALGQQVAFRNLVDQVCTEFGAPGEQVEHDLAHLIIKLDEAGLVRCRLQ